MADEKISILVSLKDEASKGLKNIIDEAGKFENAAAASKKFAAGLAAIGAAATAAAAFSVNAAREQIKVENQLDAVIKSTGGAAGLTAEQIKSMAAELQTMSNFGDEAILAGQNLLLTFTQIGEETFPQATQIMVDMAAAMGTDVSSQAIQLGKALNDPIAGISALSRVGVQLTEDQKGLIHSFMEVGDTAAAQQVILDELAVQFGGSAEAQIDPIIQLQNVIGDIAEQIGMKLLPFINEVAAAFMEWVDSVGGAAGVVEYLQEKFEAIEPWLPIIAGAIVGALVPALGSLALAAAASILPLLPYIAVGAAIVAAIMLIKAAIEALGPVLTAIGEYFASVWEAIKLKTSEVFTSVATFFEEVWTGISEFFQTVLDGLIFIAELAFALLFGGIILALEFFGVDWEMYWTQMSEFFTLIWETIQNSFTIVMDAITNIWTSGWNSIKAVASTVWGGIETIVQGAWDWISGIFTDGIALLSDAWTVMWEGFGNAASLAWEGIKSVVASGINWVIDKINSLISKVNSVSGTVGGPQIDLIPAITFATGGRVPMVDYSPVGGDTVPALLSPGERVLTQAENRAYEAGNGFGGPKIELHFYDTQVLSDDDIVEKIGDPIINVFKQHFAV